MAKHKHLTLDERYTIQHMLDAKESFASIARAIGKDRSTISKEVRSHLTFKKSGCLGWPFNDCAERTNCGKFFCTAKCDKCHARCAKCLDNCVVYEKETCPRHASAPYVCNGCSKRTRCTLEKRIYSARYADQEYRLNLRETRQGLAISEQEAHALDEIISPLILNGQSIHHICSANRGSIMYCEKTIYNYLDAGLFTACNIDLPRKVKFRPRKSSHETVKIDKQCRVGRTYQDFLEFRKEHPDTPVVQMDSVIGSVGGKCLLTIHFVKPSFMLAFLRERNTAASVHAVIERLYKVLDSELFSKLFPVILTDNGSEFSDPLSIEVDSDGVLRTRVFYCDPSSPEQKGAIENNHTFIRRAIPKGKTFDDLSQEDVDLMMDHINSYKRENLAWRSPYEVFDLFYGRDTLKKLGANHVDSNDIILLPKLLK